MKGPNGAAELEFRSCPSGILFDDAPLFVYMRALQDHDTSVVRRFPNHPHKIADQDLATHCFIWDLKPKYGEWLTAAPEKDHSTCHSRSSSKETLFNRSLNHAMLDIASEKIHLTSNKNYQPLTVGTEIHCSNVQTQPQHYSRRT